MSEEFGFLEPGTTQEKGYEQFGRRQSTTTSGFAPKDSIKYSPRGFLGNALSSMPSATYYTRLSICHPIIAHNLYLTNNKKIIIE